MNFGTGFYQVDDRGLLYISPALMAGVILNTLGMPGVAIVDRIRARRPGALFNETFASYLEDLP